MNTYQIILEPHGDHPRYEAQTAHVTDGGALVISVGRSIIASWPAHAWRHMYMVAGPAVQ